MSLRRLLINCVSLRNICLLARGVLLPRSLPVCSRVHICTQLSTDNLKIQDDFFTHLNARGQEMEGSLSLLLLLAANWNDQTNIQYLLKLARTAGVRPSGYTMEKVLNVYIKRKRLNEGVSLFGSIKEEYTETSLDTCTVLHLCTILVENNRCLEAVQILRDFVEADKRPEMFPQKITESCKSLLNKAAETAGYEITKQIFDLIIGKLIDPGPQVVAPLLQCKLDRGDLQGIIEETEYIYSHFNTLPKRMEIFITLMQNNPPSESTLLNVLNRNGGQARESTDHLGRIFDLVQTCYGSMQAQHDLLFASLESGCPVAARLVLQTLGDDVDERQLLRMCKLYAKNERVSALEHLRAASKGMSNMDRAKICELLLDAYKLSNNKVGEKSRSLWISMQEERLTPSSSFIFNLTTILKQNNIEIPPDTMKQSFITDHKVWQRMNQNID